MKTWFYKHPNATFVLLGALYLWLVWCTVRLFVAERWGWAAAGGDASQRRGYDQSWCKTCMREAVESVFAAGPWGTWRS